MVGTVFLRMPGCRVQVGAAPRRQSSHDGPAKIQNAVNDFVGSLANDYFLPINKGDDGIRRMLNELYEVGVQRDGIAVQSGQLNHNGAFPVRRESWQHLYRH